MQIVYTAHATVTGGRNGHGETDDKKVNVDLSSPGTAGNGTNPEQLFAVGYAACFGGAVQFLAKQQSLEVGNVTIKCDVNLHKGDAGFALSAVMDVALPDMAPEAAKKLVHDTHQFCPYSKATRGNIDVTLKVNGNAI